MKAPGWVNTFFIYIYSLIHKHQLSVLDNSDLMDKVLIVDDDLKFQRLLGTRLQKYESEFEIILANNGEESIGILEPESLHGSLKGISVVAFLQMIEFGEKTCLLEVFQTNDEKGLLYFKNGVLYDAAYRDLEGKRQLLK